MKSKRLNQKHIDNLQHAVRTAINTFQDSKRQMDNVVSERGVPGLMTLEAAQGMSKQFQHYLDDQEVLDTLLENARGMLVEVEPCDDCKKDFCMCGVEDPDEYELENA